MVMMHRHNCSQLVRERAREMTRSGPIFPRRQLGIHFMALLQTLRTFFASRISRSVSKGNLFGWTKRVWVVSLMLVSTFVQFQAPLPVHAATGINRQIS